MGGTVAGGFPNQHFSDSFFGGPSLRQPQGAIAGRRTMPGGPLLPRLPRSPFVTAATRIGLRFPFAFSRDDECNGDFATAIPPDKLKPDQVR